MLIYAALGTFSLAFLLIVFDVFDKALIAMLGALVMIILRIITPEEAIAAISFETILLLLAMMTLVNIASKSGIFNWISVKIASLTKGNPLAIFLLFSFLTAVSSAFLDNVTTVILIVPLTIELVKGMGKDPKPYIFAEMMFSDMGGALTLIGDPSNILIGGASGLSFMQFIQNLWIPILFSSILTAVAFVVVFWKKLKPISKDLGELFVANVIIERIKHRYLRKTLHKDFVIKVVIALLITMLGFFFQEYIGLPNYVIAFTAAVILGIVTSKRVNIVHTLESVEWTTLLFFSGLFIMVAGVEKTGILFKLSEWISNSTTDITYLSLMILWISGGVSMVLNNVPFITVMLPVIASIQLSFGEQDSTMLWWALSMGTCLGGNATIVGSSANVVSVDLAHKEGVHISFLEYLKFSLPLTIGVLSICSAYIILKLN
ncbi:hypothetical protein COU74_02320 [Candidatus Peregrinibacteria bacterium CG10_big_fil_rev_8_21_14_0_10_36_19]|nr:MAG: hypothetical protein COU74_02320 [Candidatus Peregrinibacteria bacterium CG10_big_fil_rev_8_21_14_0_10_36_19]